MCGCTILKQRSSAVHWIGKTKNSAAILGRYFCEYCRHEWMRFHPFYPISLFKFWIWEDHFHLDKPEERENLQNDFNLSLQIFLRILRQSLVRIARCGTVKKEQKGDLLEYENLAYTETKNGLFYACSNFKYSWLWYFKNLRFITSCRDNNCQKSWQKNATLPTKYQTLFLKSLELSVPRRRWTPDRVREKAAVQCCWRSSLRGY